MKNDPGPVDFSLPAYCAGLFAGLPPDQVRAVVTAGTRGTYRPRHVLYAQGTPGRDFYLLESGLVRLHEISPTGHEHLVRFVASGETFGYFGIVGGANLASAHVTVASTIIRWERTVAMELLKQFPRLATNLFGIAVRDAVYFYERARSLRFEPADKRILWALSHLMRAAGERTGKEAIAIFHGAKLRDVAELASTTIYTASREITKLERKGILEKSRNRITILQPNRLPST